MMTRCSYSSFFLYLMPVNVLAAGFGSLNSFYTYIRLVQFDFCFFLNFYSIRFLFRWPSSSCLFSGASLLYSSEIVLEFNFLTVFLWAIVLHFTGVIFISDSCKISIFLIVLSLFIYLDFMRNSKRERAVKQLDHAVE